MALEKLCKFFRFGCSFARNAHGSPALVRSAVVKDSQIISKKAGTLPSTLKMTQLETDVCHFASDRSLSPEFLKSLLNTEGRTNADKIINMKDKVLRAMGHEHPEFVKVKINNAMDYTMGFDLESGTLIINEAFLNSPQACSGLHEAIALLRHEFDHLDKLVKTYKSVGAQKFVSAIEKRYEITGSKLKNFNYDFYEQMSKQVNVENFDSKYWLDAIENVKVHKPPKNATYYDGFMNSYLYSGNKLERSAYGVQSQVQEAFGASPLTVYDVYYDEFGKILKTLENPAILDKGQTFHNLYYAADIMRQTGDRSLVAALAQSKNTLSAETSAKLKHIADYHSPSLSEEKQMLETVHNWLLSGKYSINDILPML